MKKQNRITTALVAVALLSIASGCSLFRSKSTEGEASAGSAESTPAVVTETTSAGGTEKVDTTPMNMTATGSDSGTIEGLQTVHFDFDKATVSSSERAKLMGNVAWMKKNSSSKMLIEGHCDQRGSTEYNLSLGERRANAVKQMLVNQGVSASRLTTVSFGKEKLIAEGDSDSDMAKNRRANFVPTSN